MNIKKMYGELTKQIKDRIKKQRSARKLALKLAKENNDKDLIHHLEQELRIEKILRKRVKESYKTLK